VEVTRTEAIVMMHWGGMGAWGPALMTVGGLLFWALLIAGAVYLVRAVGGHERHEHDDRHENGEEVGRRPGRDQRP